MATAPRWCIKSANGHLPGATVVPVLNVSRIFWLELEDKALLDSYTVLQEGILCDDWLNFMLSQNNLWPTFCEAPRTRYLTIPWIPRNLRRRYERCSRKQQKLKHSFTRKSSATLSVLFTQPTKQSVVLVMFCLLVDCFPLP